MEKVVVDNCRYTAPVVAVVDMVSTTLEAAMSFSPFARLVYDIGGNSLHTFFCISTSSFNILCSYC